MSLRGTHPSADAGRILREILVDTGQAGGHGVVAGGRLRIGGRNDKFMQSVLEQALERRLAEKLHKGEAPRSTALLKKRFNI